MLALDADLYTSVFEPLSGLWVLKVFELSIIRIVKGLLA